MKNILLAASLLLIGASSQAQGFQIGYAAGLVSNYPDNSRGLGYPANDNSPKINPLVANGVFVRYEYKKRIALQLNALEYNTSYHFFEVENRPPNTAANEPAISYYTSGVVREQNYLLDLSLQVNVNFNKALRNPHFKGVKSYIGVSYTGMIHRVDGQVMSYDAVMQQNSAFEDRYNIKERAIGANYYGSYSLSRHVILSLQATLRLSTNALTPADWGNNSIFFTYGGNKVGGYNGDYTTSISLGLAYKLGKH